MGILFVSEDVPKPKISKKCIDLWLKSIINKNNFISGDITFIFCSDDYLLKINIDYLQHDYYTDIITFDYTLDSIISGDLYISIDRVTENSLEYGTSFKWELLRVIVHGILHLLGYSDKSDEDRNNMRKLEDESLMLYKKIENGYIE